jgi:hypothetical protein
VNDVFMKNGAYGLKENDDRCEAGGFHELHAYDYFLSYWYARKMGVILAPSGETVGRTCIRRGGGG